MPKAAKARKAPPIPTPEPTPAEAAPERERGPQTYVSNFVLSVGPMTTMGKLVNVRKSDKTGRFVTMCPDCNTPQMKMRYACPNPNHVLDLKDGTTAPATYETQMVGKAAKMPDGSFAPVSAEDVKEANKSALPKDEMEVSIHPAAEVHNFTWSDDNAYVLFPRSPSDKAYGTIAKAVAKGEYAFLGPCNLKNHEGFFRLDVWQGHIVIQKCVFPEDCNVLDDPVPDADDLLLNAMEGMLERVVTPFDPSAYQNATKERLAALKQSLSDGTTYTPPTPVKTTDTTADLLAALEAFAASR